MADINPALERKHKCLKCGKQIPLLMNGCGEHWHQLSWAYVFDNIKYLRVFV